MIPLIPALALAFFSFLCSAFVIFRIVIPILPPHPLSRRVAPSEFGLPNFRSLTPADKSHVWLASLDLLALCLFIWQAVSSVVAQDPLPSVRLWLIMTVRQTCLLVVAGLTLLHVRLGRSVSFGKKHWMLWGPALILICTSTAVAGILSAAGLGSLFVGLVAYSSTLAVISSAAFIGLVVTLVVIQKNLASMNEGPHSWPPMRQMEDKPRPSFATEEIDAMRDGASWITSNASSRRDSVSAWSFNTHHTHHSGRPQSASHPSVPAKSSYWFGSSTFQVDAVPPVPPLPSPYGPLSPTSESLSEPDPFRRMPSPLPQHPRERLDSQTSWLTSSHGSHATMSAWSFPATHTDSMHNASSTNLHTALLPTTLVASSRPATPGLVSAQVLGGYGYKDSEKGTSATRSSNSLDISVYRTIGWLTLIWIPLGLSFPYLIASSQNTPVSLISSILFALSVTMSSPVLVLNILFRSPIPIPSGLFDAPNNLPTDLLRGPSPTSTETVKWSHEYKRSASASVTVVEGRRSGDVWLTNGDATDGKGKVSRALGMISPMPKLSVLPVEEDNEEPTTPPLPIQEGDSSLPVNIHSRSHSETSAQFGRIRKDSKASSYYSGADDSLAFASHIMIAQKHYSTLAQTIQVNGSPEKEPSAGAHLFLDGAVGSTSAVDVVNRRASHLRTRSVASVSGPQTPTSAMSFRHSPTPPPAFPLPPTPPNVRAARLAQHKKSYSSISDGKFSFGPVDDMNEIDALTAGVLPLLVPGLTVGGDMRIRDSPPATWRRRAAAELEVIRDGSRSRSTSRTRGEGKTARLLRALNEFGEDFSSPQIHSTPARTRAGASKAREPRGRKTSAHKRNHFSLPSLGLGKEGMQYWSNEIGRAIDSRLGQYTALPSNVELRRNTVFGADSIPNDLTNLRATPEEVAYHPKPAALGRAMSTRSLGLRAEVPHGVDTARSSIASLSKVPQSAASTVTLFEDFVNGMESGPQAESTPHNNVAHKRGTEDVVPPLPSSSHYRISAASSQFRDSSNINPPNRRSSIVYIKSDEEATVTPPNASSTSAMSSLAQWSSRAVRPLMPKSSKLQRKASKASTRSTSKPESPKGLRPLSLLQERDANAIAGPSVIVAKPSGTRPLLLGKKEGASSVSSKKAKARPSDENASPDVPRSRLNKHNLKPLDLTRSDTSKMRAILRHEELLPDVVVRPPSTTEHQVYAYSFRD
ncbi:hypothetical protein BDP27DRAFT_1355562 [Rhodocollybia butyracea]|uniref:Uncharacterized protein n=1 Tax=Rhodocollybia butyracea TaxID=206335 RepID=A0A9P5NZW2_9AGAR|nr:hypothetical protein BDP27DRAFT_1355562 [Rhodocollybia butyracea]